MKPLGVKRCSLKKHCIDVTIESGRLGRPLNHSRTSSNLKIWQVPNLPRIILKAIKDIPAGIMENYIEFPLRNAMAKIVTLQQGNIT